MPFVTNMPIMLSVVMLSVIMLSVVAPYLKQSSNDNCRSYVMTDNV